MKNKNIHVIDNTTTEGNEIKKVLKMKKVNLNQDDIDEMSGFFAQRVFQPQIFYKTMSIETLDAHDLITMVAIHLMNINRSANLKSSTSKFELRFNDTDRYVIINISDAPSVYKTRDIVVEAFVSKHNEDGYIDIPRRTFGIDPVDGLDYTHTTLYDFMDDFVEAIYETITTNETNKEIEFKKNLVNKMRSEYTKFTAMRTIDPLYNRREVKLDDPGIDINFEYQMVSLPVISNLIPRTILTMSQNDGSIIAEIDTENSPTISELTHVVNRCYELFKKNGGTLNG